MISGIVTTPPSRWICSHSSWRNGGDERVFAPAVPIRRHDLTDPGTGDVQGIGDVGLAGPVAGRL